MSLLRVTESGLYCASGDFHIDPWRPADFAIITHAHSDHARRGSRRYLCAESGRAILQERLGADARIQGLPFGTTVERHGVRISLHPAGHILGSAQVRIEHRGEVWVVSGDYKVAPDPAAEAFEPMRCHTFVTESTFGLPIYRWPATEAVFEDIHQWWRRNQGQGRTSVLFAYSLGKAQRLLAGLDASIGPIHVHGSVTRFLPHYQSAGVQLAQVTPLGEKDRAEKGAMVIAPASTMGTPWMRRFGEIATGFASGWMQIRGARRRQSLDRGFVLSDHADWPALLDTVRATGAENIWVTHGHVAPMVRWLQENGWKAEVVPTRFEGESPADAEPEEGAS